MTIKLVRTDTISPCKVNLLKGEHVFGRGKLLDCNDKRISRQHGQLNVSDNSLTIKALHQNPCFFQKKDSKETEILKLHDTTVLNNGDRFGLLPDAYWFEVLICPDDNEPNTETSENDTEDFCLEQTNCDKTSSEANIEESVINCDDNLNTGHRPESPSLLSNSDDKSVPKQNDLLDEISELAECTSKESPNTQSEKQEEIRSNAEIKDVEDTRNSPNKRPLSPDNIDIKKIKTEPSVKDEPSKDDSEPDVKPGSSTNQMKPARPAKNEATVKPRERCMYGAQCYRQNPGHLAQFSHPVDADWGAGQRGQCPYGVACRRRLPAHWQDNDHPPGAQPPPPPIAGQRRRKTPARNLPAQDLPAKRVRKTVQSLDFIDSDSENGDPFATDESDEWEPDSGATTYSEDYL